MPVDGEPSEAGGRAPTGRRRPRRRTLAVAAVITLVAVGAGGYALRGYPKTCSGEPLPVDVAAAPDIEPALAEIAARFNVQAHTIVGRCVRVDVTERDPATVARALADGKVPGDGWVPDSSMWANRVSAGVAPGALSIATSPVVIAASRPVAEELRRHDIRPSWRLLRPHSSLRELDATVRMLDPATNAAGVATVVAAGPKIVPRMREHSVADPSTLFASLRGIADMRRVLVVATEQSVLHYNDTHRPNPADVLMPHEGTVLLDYPLAVTTSDPKRREALDAFRWALRGGPARDTLQRYGFRTPEAEFDPRFADRYDVSADAPEHLVRPTKAKVATALREWPGTGA